MKKICSKLLVYIMAAMLITTCNISVVRAGTSSTYSPKWVMNPNNNYISIYSDEKNEIFIFQDSATSLYGVADHNGKIIHKPQFTEYVHQNDAKRLLVKKGGKWGLMDYSGKLIVQPIYEDTSEFRDALILVKRSGELTILDINGKAQLGFVKAEDMSFPKEGLIAIQDKNEKWGYIDQKGKIVIPCKFDTVRDFSEGLAVVGMKDVSTYNPRTGNYVWYYGYIDKQGKTVIPIKYTEAYDFSNGLATVIMLDELGYDRYGGVINKAGEIIVPFDRKYRNVSYFTDKGIAAFTKSAGAHSPTYMGFIDKTGKVIIPEHLAVTDPTKIGLDMEAKDFDENGLKVMGYSSNDWAVYHYSGKKIMDSSIIAKHPILSFNGPKYKKCYPRIIDGLLPVYSGAYWFLIDLEGNPASQAQYSNILVNDEFILVSEGNEPDKYYGMADFKFNLVYPIISKRQPMEVSPGVYLADIDMPRLTDSKGNVLIPKDIYISQMAGTGDGLTGIDTAARKSGYIDSNTLEIVIPAKYDYIRTFHKGLAAVAMGEKWGLINKKGQYLIPPTFDYIEYGNDNVIRVMQNGKWGLVENPLNGSTLSNAMPLDSTPSAWAAADIEKAKGYNLTTNKVLMNFRQNITREEFCELVVKLYESLSEKTVPLPKGNKFTDTSNPEVLKANSLGIVNGISANQFGPNNSVTREQMAVMLHNLLNALNIAPVTTMEYVYFSDENQISSWAKNSMQLMNKVGIVGGLGENRVAPTGNATREQAIIMVKRVFENFRQLRN